MPPIETRKGRLHCFFICPDLPVAHHHGVRRIASRQPNTSYKKFGRKAKFFQRLSSFDTFLSRKVYNIKLQNRHSSPSGLIIVTKDPYCKTHAQLKRSIE
ncbi:hypothetical protein [Methanococcus voltae]|uniref:hypothetical protein n=1 Tax=Methanococcus voltae TaxID=2188 RepID=UPI001AE3740E|nr:hypothetical protein [Methanococcus voltae]MBP2173282.1 hypothetical protein [Methanococcus voltae]